jgi:hypothetical protein
VESTLGEAPNGDRRTSVSRAISGPVPVFRLLEAKRTGYRYCSLWNTSRGELVGKVSVLSHGPAGQLLRLKIENRLLRRARKGLGMANTPWSGGAVRRSALLCVALVLVGAPSTLAQRDKSAIYSPLTVEQVVQNLEQGSRGRARALRSVEGKRVYRLQYHGPLGDRDAEMVVKVEYQAPAKKRFTVISQSGSKFINDRIFKKLLEGEREAFQLENQEATALNAANYAFKLEGYEETPEGARYILSVLPKSKNKFLYRGKIWVDAVDFAVVRIVAEPAKSPSFWIKKSMIEHTYVKVDSFWLPAGSRTETEVRLSGLAVLSIEYRDYKITRADPLTALNSALETKPVLDQLGAPGKP